MNYQHQNPPQYPVTSGPPHCPPHLPPNFRPSSFRPPPKRKSYAWIFVILGIVATVVLIAALIVGNKQGIKEAIDRNNGIDTSPVLFNESCDRAPAATPGNVPTTLMLSGGAKDVTSVGPDTLFLLTVSKMYDTPYQRLSDVDNGKLDEGKRSLHLAWDSLRFKPGEYDDRGELVLPSQLLVKRYGGSDTKTDGNLASNQHLCVLDSDRPWASGS